MNLATTDVLDTETMAFALGPIMQEQRYGCVAVLLPGENCVLVVGGSNGATRVTTTEIVDIDTMTFSPGPVMSLGRSWCAVVSLSCARPWWSVAAVILSRRQRSPSLPQNDVHRSWADDAHGALSIRRVCAAARPLATPRACRGRVQCTLKHLVDGGAHGHESRDARERQRTG